MRFVLAVLLLALLPFAAHAASVTVTVTTSAGTCASGCTHSFTVADANLTALAADSTSRCTAQVPPKTDGTAGTPCTASQGVTYFFTQEFAPWIQALMTSINAAASPLAPVVVQ